MITRLTWSARSAANSSASARGAMSVSECSNRLRIAWPRSVAPGSRVTRTSRPSARRVAARRSICVDLPEPSPPSNAISRPPAARSPAGPIPGQRHLDVVPDRHMMALVERAIGQQSEHHGDQAEADEHVAGAVHRESPRADRNLVLADLRNDEVHRGDRQDQHDPDQRLQHRKYPAADFVADLGARAGSRPTGRPVRPRTRRRSRRSSPARSAGISPATARQTPPNTIANPNSRRRESSRATRGPSAIPMPSPMKTQPNNTPYGALPPPRLRT